ncbi:MAG: hypothetical protein NTZ73_02345 [Candidatus Diapherotrites archaeon]|nr:hypothetical protein [Candidatus Diapherotrites archaeon]
MPIKLVPADAVKSLDDIIRKKKRWHKFEIATLKLILVPYFYFNYHYFKEKEKGGEKIIESSVDGFLAMNGETLQIDEETTTLIKENIKAASAEAPGIEFEIIETGIEKKEQETVLKLKLAEYFQISKANVVISSTKKILLPLYKSFVTVEEGTFQVLINAVNGEISGIEKVPARERELIEITKETINELKDPAAWVEYTKGILFETKKIVVPKKMAEKSARESKKSGSGEGFSIDLNFFSSKWILVLIMILALFVIYMALFGRR